MTDTPNTILPTNHEGTPTSLAQLFGQTWSGTQVTAIEIPLFQRDYAQGRQSEQARLVRERFVTSLCRALDGGSDIHLDFIFGDVVDGKLYPLDGQQRLTTLFLLHCYLAWHMPETAHTAQPWHAFHYATRPGARKFCAFLTECRPDMRGEKVSAWLYDQSSYLPTWKHDPTVQGMLVVLDALHEHYRGKPSDDLRFAWQRLTDPVNPAISFLLLPVAAQQLDNTLYVKMNSRGRPLTDFENFKAELEALLHKNPAMDAASVDAFSRKVDTDWADLFWQYRGENDLLDEECMRYLRFLFEVRAWKRGLPVQTSGSDLKALALLSEAVLGTSSPDSCADFTWIVQALDAWVEKDANSVCKPKAIATLFQQIFTREAHCATTPLRIFNFRDFGDAPVGVDLFHACCMLYGTRAWSLAHTVLMYGVLHGMMYGTPSADLLPRLRLLRNLIEASRSEIRADSTRNNMPALLSEVEIIIAGGPLAEVKTFNQVQVRNEQAKQALVAAHPQLQEVVYLLEDHELLRGGLTVFDLDSSQAPEKFRKRADAFHQLFKHPYHLVNAALLAKGHHGRERTRGSGYSHSFLGAPRQRQAGLWEDHLRIRYNEPVHPSSIPLMNLLDNLAAGHTPQTVIDTFLAYPETVKDWRYYIAKYEAMRGAHLDFAGTYVLSPYPGYAICMPKSDSCDNRSNHHDAYLLALVQVAGVEPDHIGNDGWPRCFPGYETEERSLTLRRSGIQILCVDAGWQFSDVPKDDRQRQTFENIITRYPRFNAQHLYAIPQNNNIDAEDRIELGSRLLRELVDAGL